MATLASKHLHPVTRDRRFFFIMSLAIAITVVAGFSLQFVAGRSSLGAPWWVHVHGVTMIGWLAIYVTQNWLILTGRLVAHARFGRVAAVYAGWVLLVGAVLTPTTIAFHRDPPFFGSGAFLAMDWLTVLTFAALVWAGVMLRGASEWHKRLMLCSAFVVMIPGVGRLTPLPLMGEWILWGIFAAALPFWAAALIYDLVTRGRVHPAYYWGFAAYVAMTVLIRPLGESAPIQAFLQHLAA